MTTNNDAFVEERSRALTHVCLAGSALIPGPEASFQWHSVIANVPTARMVLPTRWSLLCLGKVAEASPSTPLSFEKVLLTGFQWEGSHLTPIPVAAWDLDIPQSWLRSAGIKGSLDGWGRQEDGVGRNNCSLSTYWMSELNASRSWPHLIFYYNS